MPDKSNLKSGWRCALALNEQILWLKSGHSMNTNSTRSADLIQFSWTDKKSDAHRFESQKLAEEAADKLLLPFFDFCLEECRSVCGEEDRDNVILFWLDM